MSEPGVSFGYSNIGYVLLATVVENAVGIPWEQLIFDRVVKPLKMDSFGFGVPTPLKPCDAVGHTEDGEPVPLAKDKPWMIPSFSAHSTLEDWEKFAKFHASALKGQFSRKASPIDISEETMRLFHTPASPSYVDETFNGSEEPNGYAMGWHSVWDYEEGKVVTEPTDCLWHFGTNFVFNSGIYISSPLDLVALVVSNSGSMVARLASRMALEGLIEFVRESS
eukprot:TRINITY_DN1947_c0_g1_i1.p1 TRINITY_DN1947_c0_g1~~TRINITY_DN1947_c0_g1_i1.p1  ORF type:complete len:223 (+),score=37.92 TRINITY_DN1947_c0_g1_i1:325-993(+)